MVFVDTNLPLPDELANNEDFREFGFRYYIGAPWQCVSPNGGNKVGADIFGTVAVMERREGILKNDHVSIVEHYRDLFLEDMYAHDS